MISGVQSAFSGLQAYGTWLSAVASNVANVNTEGYRRTRVLLEEQKAGGVQAVTEKVDFPRFSTSIETGFGLELVLGSGVDPARELSDMIQAGSIYQAQLSTIEAESAMEGSILDNTV